MITSRQLSPKRVPVHAAGISSFKPKTELDHSMMKIAPVLAFCGVACAICGIGSFNRLIAIVMFSLSRCCCIAVIILAAISLARQKR